MTVVVREIPTRALGAGTTLERIYRATDEHGRARSPWYCSCRDTEVTGRFDLPRPRGTCYLADHLDGAFLEVFRGAWAVASTDVASRRAMRATATREHAPWTDLTDAKAVRAGVTLDVYAGNDYTTTRELAVDADAMGSLGIISLLRHQSAGRLRSIAMFGPAGEHRAAPAGWTAQREALSAAVVRLSPELRQRIRDVPHTLRAVPPPSV